MKLKFLTIFLVLIFLSTTINCAYSKTCQEFATNIFTNCYNTSKLIATKSYTTAWNNKIVALLTLTYISLTYVFGSPNPLAWRLNSKKNSAETTVFQANSNDTLVASCTEKELDTIVTAYNSAIKQLITIQWNNDMRAEAKEEQANFIHNINNLSKEDFLSIYQSSQQPLDKLKEGNLALQEQGRQKKNIFTIMIMQSVGRIKDAPSLPNK